MCILAIRIDLIKLPFLPIVTPEPQKGRQIPTCGKFLVRSISFFLSLATFDPQNSSAEKKRKHHIYQIASETQVHHA